MYRVHLTRTKKVSTYEEYFNRYLTRTERRHNTNNHGSAHPTRKGKPAHTYKKRSARGGVPYSSQLSGAPPPLSPNGSLHNDEPQRRTSRLPEWLFATSTANDDEHQRLATALALRPAWVSNFSGVATYAREAVTWTTTRLVLHNITSRPTEMTPLLRRSQVHRNRASACRTSCFELTSCILVVQATGANCEPTTQSLDPSSKPRTTI